MKFKDLQIGDVFWFDTKYELGRVYKKVSDFQYVPYDYDFKWYVHDLGFRNSRCNVILFLRQYTQKDYVKALLLVRRLLQPACS